MEASKNLILKADENMKKLLSVLITLALILTIIAGCSNSTPEPSVDESDFDIGSTPPLTTDVPDTESPPIVSGGGSETEERELEWWEIDVVRVPDDLVPDPSQTGELNLFFVYNPDTFVYTPVINRYRVIYPNVNLIVESTNGNFDAYSTRLSTELMAGTGPDVISPSQIAGADVVKMADAGVFMDLNKLIESDDSFNLDDYVGAVMDGGVLNGKRYIMPHNFLINSLLYVPSRLESIGFDMSQMNDPILFMDEIVRTLPKAQETHGFRYMYNGNLLVLLFRTSGIKIIDEETKTVLPDEEHFERFIKAYKPYYRFDMYSGQREWNDTSGGLINSKLIMFDQITTILDFVWHAGTLKRFSGEIQMHTMPDINGENQVYLVDSIAIREGTPNEQNAWNFVKLLLSEENQSRAHFSQIPVHKNVIFPQIIFAYNDGSIPGLDFLGYKSQLSTEEIEVFYEMVTGVTARHYYNDWFYLPLIWDYLMSYFEDETSYEDMVARIKNDLRLYLSE